MYAHGRVSWGCAWSQVGRCALVGRPRRVRRLSCGMRQPSAGIGLLSILTDVGIGVSRDAANHILRRDNKANHKNVTALTNLALQ